MKVETTLNVNDMNEATAVQVKAETIEFDGKTYPLPVLGQDIYMKTSVFIGHGEDDFDGGLCKISYIDNKFNPKETNKIWQGNSITIEVEENAGWRNNWFYIMDHQEEWSKEYGKRRGKMNPDYHNYEKYA